MLELIKRDEMQNVLDLLGYAENIPIRIIDIDALDSISPTDLLGEDSLSEEEAVKKIAEIVDDVVYQSALAVSTRKYPHLNNPTKYETETLDEMPRIVREMSTMWHGPSNDIHNNLGVTAVDELERRIWPNYPSNPLGIDNLFRFSIEWRWYCLLWAFTNKEFFRNQGSTYSYGLEGWEIYCKPLSTKNARFSLVIGPCYKITKERSVVDFHRTYGLSILQSYAYFHNNYGRWGITKRFTAEEMERVLHTRTPISDAATESRGTTILKVFENLCHYFETVGKPPHPISEKSYLIPRVCRAILLSMRLARSDELFQLLRKAQDSTPNLGDSILLSLSFPIYDENCYYELSVIQTWTKKRTAIKSFRLDRKDKELPLGLICGIKIFDNALSRNNHAKLFDIIEQKIERWGERINSRRKSLQTLRAGMLGDWLSHQHLVNIHFGSKKGATRSSRISPVFYYNFVCRIINEGLRTDACTLYRYESHREDSGLKVIGNNLRPGTWKREEISQVEKYMEEIANTSSNNVHDLSKKSLVYYSLKHNTSSYIIGYGTNAEIKNAFLTNDTLAWPTDVAPPGDIMVAPILVQGRVWGVVEISTKKPFNIQANLRFSLNHYAALLGTYFFNITFTNSIKNLGAIARKAEPNGHSRNSFDEICNLISQLFLARSCAILVSDVSNPFEYKVVGIAGAKYFEPNVQDSSFDMSQPACKDLFIGKMYDAYKSSESKKVLLGKIDPNLKDCLVDDETPYYILGSEYAKNTGSGSVIHKLIADDIKQVMAFVFDPEKTDIIEKTPSSRADRITADLRNIDSHGRGSPLGIVLVYNQRFENLSHWYGVTEILSEHLLTCVDKILITGVREEARGNTIRHEINRTIDSIEDADISLRMTLNNIENVSKRAQRQLNQVLALRVSKSGNVLRERSWNDLNENERNDLLKWVAEMPENLLELNRVCFQAKKTISAHFVAFDQLRAQIAAVEKPEMFDIEKFLGIDSDEQYSNVLLEAGISEMLEQYHAELYNRKGCSLSVNGIKKNLYLRMSPAVFSYLLRNIFDNWTKYAQNHTSLDIDLTQRSESGTSYYILSFRNVGQNLDESVGMEDLFEYGVRGVESNSAIPGDGVGLFWHKKILKLFFDIDVSMNIEARGNGATSYYTISWRLDRHWLTTENFDEVY